MPRIADCLLTDAAEHVAATHDLEARIDLGREDELGRLAAAFNTMLAALEEARISQHRLVTDASLELRTPLTSLRTNLIQSWLSHHVSFH